ncbi:hydrolase TatD [bacterium (Candidatus Torokbacteria) CG_4_10_14_0_2_um_filter_35_8]|nr:MAG: hydrolase TatD [bacterium (Candidatus Torokbacteria) CG_4_10_14_0_2_um_filter_35_8]
MLIDTHAHLDFKEFGNDREEVIKRAFDNGVEKIICVGCGPEHSNGSVELARKYDNIFASVGIHPHDLNKVNLEALSELEKLSKFLKVVAIGEIGLDYFRLEDKKDKPKQIKVFEEQLRLVGKLNLPVIFHCRDAYPDILKILWEFKKDYNFRGVTHCFSGSQDYAEKFLDLGLLLSFTGAITYTEDPDAEIFEVIKKTPLDKIMIETDCPYLAPHPHRGERNEPAFVKFVAEKIAEVKGVDFKTVASKTTRNAEELFEI